MNDKMDTKYRIHWIGSKSKKSCLSPFVFSYKDIKRRIKNLKKLCPKTEFDIQESDKYLLIEVYPEKRLYGQELFDRLREIERSKQRHEKKT